MKIDGTQRERKRERDEKGSPFDGRSRVHGSINTKEATERFAKVRTRTRSIIP